MNQNADKISDAELEVLEAVWDTAPATYAEVRAALEQKNGWDSSTIRTLLRRLVAKGALTQEKQEVYYYRPTITRGEYRESKTNAFVEKLYDGSVKGLLTALVTTRGVTAAELDELRALLEQEAPHE